MWLTLWRTVTIISRFSDTYVHRLLINLLRWWLVLLLTLELITVTHYFTEWLTWIWISYSVYKTEQPELLVVLEVSTYLLHRNFITCIGYWCDPLNCQHCVFDQERWTSHSTFLTYLHSYQPTRLIRSSTQDLLTVPCCKTVLSGRQFLVAAVRIWNSLPQELRKCETLGTFKKYLKTHLFHQDII